MFQIIYLAIIFKLSVSQSISSACTVKLPNLTIQESLECTNLYAFQVNQDNEITISENKVISNDTSVEHLFIGDITTMMSEEGYLESVLTFDAPVILQTGTIRTSKLVSPSFSELLQTQQWQLIHHDDFEADSSLIGWNIPYRSYCDLKSKKISQHSEDNQQQEDFFLTSHCAPQNNNLRKIFTATKAHKHIKVQAELHVFGDWSGENVAMLLNDKVAWTKSFHGSDPIDHPCPQLLALSVPVEAIADTEESEITVSFISTQKRHPCDGSFAIDDLLIYFK